MIHALVIASVLAAGNPVTEAQFPVAMRREAAAAMASALGKPGCPFVIDARSVTGREEDVRSALAKLRSEAAVDRSVARWHDANGGAAEFTADEAFGCPVADLSSFAIAGGYDWERLKAEYPSAEAVFRLSLPGIDDGSGYAVVRFERVDRDGVGWKGIFTFERDAKGAWTGGTMVTWVPDRTTPGSK